MAGATGAQAQPNPFAGLGGFGGMGGFPGMGFGGMGGFGMPQAAPADTRTPREKYATQLLQIKEMGFHDEETIL